MKRTHALLLAILVSICACGTPSSVSPGPHPGGAPALPVSGFRAVDEGVAVSGQPSDDALRQAAAEGYRSVVNFRADGEPGDPAAEGRLASSLGMRYARVPVAHGDVTDESADRLADLLAAEDGRPVLLHCASGQRAIAAWALYLARHGGRSADEALAAADAAGIGSAMRAALERRLHER